MNADTSDHEPFGFFEFAAADPEAVAVIDIDGTTTTRGEVASRAHRLSNALVAAGVEIDDRVAFLSHNSVEYFVWSFACGQIGAHIVPLNFHSTPDELAYIVDNSSSKVVAVAADLTDLGRAALDAAEFTGARVALSAAGGFTPYDDFLHGHTDAPPALRTFGGVMLYTSGTTGRPKGVLRTATQGVTPEAAARAGRPMFARRGMSLGGTSIVCGPLYHGAPGAQGFHGLNWGHSIVLTERWNSTEVLELIERHAVTHAQMAPIHFHRLLQLAPDVRERYVVSTLQAVTHAGSGCPVDVKQAMIDWFGPVLFEYYAASEGFATSISPDDWLAHRGSVGHINSDGAEITIIAEDGSVASRGEIGSVYVRIPGAPESEYLDDPEKTAESRRDDGSQTFGDMGYIDDDGWLFLVDRRTDMILTGAVNVYPAEIEQTLVRHEGVADAAVIGVPDAEWGQRVLAIVVPTAEADLASLGDDLGAHCQRSLAKFKCPRTYEFRAELPYSGAGKLLRRELRDPYWT